MYVCMYIFIHIFEMHLLCLDCRVTSDMLLNFFVHFYTSYFSLCTIINQKIFIVLKLQRSVVLALFPQLRLLFFSPTGYLHETSVCFNVFFNIILFWSLTLECGLFQRSSPVSSQSFYHAQNSIPCIQWAHEYLLILQFHGIKTYTGHWAVLHWSSCRKQGKHYLDAYNKVSHVVIQ